MQNVTVVEGHEYVSIFTRFLSALCWTIVQYFESNAILAEPAIMVKVPEFTRCILVVYCYLGLGREDLIGKLFAYSMDNISNDSSSERFDN